MSTQSVISQPVNGGLIPAVCPTKKKSYSTRIEAEAFAQHLKTTYPDQHDQFAYQYEDCPGFHLSSQDPASFAMQNSRQVLQNPPRVTPGRLSIEDGQKRYEIVARMMPGIDMNAWGSKKELSKRVAVEWGISTDTAYQWLVITGHLDRIIRGEKFGARNSCPSAASAPKTLGSISEKRKALEAQLAALQAEEQKLIEAKQIKLLPCWEGKGVLIQQEQSRMGFQIADIPELISKLTAFFDEQI